MPPLIDLTGKVFGQLTVIGRDHETQKMKKETKPIWKCQCTCGNIVSVLGKSLRDGKTISCGCAASKRAKEINFIDITGQKFGKLTALRYLGKSRWLCKCDCGEETIAVTNHLRSGHTISCGCIRSKGEYNIAKILREKGIPYVKQYMADDLRNKNGNLIRIDFAIFDKNFKNIIGFIEYNGRQHYDKNDPWYKEIVESGLASKKEYAKKLNIPFYIIKYDDNIRDFIMENVDFSEIRE